MLGVEDQSPRNELMCGVSRPRRQSSPDSRVGPLPVVPRGALSAVKSIPDNRLPSAHTMPVSRKQAMMHQSKGERLSRLLSTLSI
jgi:hypothetical protein